jgi:hypothetical protein
MFASVFNITVRDARNFKIRGGSISSNLLVWMNPNFASVLLTVYSRVNRWCNFDGSMYVFTMQSVLFYELFIVAPAKGRLIFGTPCNTREL